MVSRLFLPRRTRGIVAFIEARMSRNKNDKPAVSAVEEASVDGVDEDVDEDLDDAEDGDAEDDEGEDTPCVVLGRLADLRGYGDPGLLRKHGDRPVWFMIQDDADFMTLFDKHPERRVPPELSRSIMDVLRSFAESESDALQTVLGATDTLQFGFHERASVDDVAEAFEDDGFDVAFVLQDGKVVDNVDDED
jgi:hypothetical protein